MIEVGQGGTYCIGGDRYPITVVKVISQRRLVVRTDSCDNPNYYRTVTLRKDGYFREVGKNVGFYSLGKKVSYLSPEF